MRKILTLLGLCLPLVCTVAAALPEDTCNHRLWYTAPASIWEETLPLGNGRLGMMPDGGISHEHIVLNEISLWSGSESDYRNPNAARSLPQIRQLLFEGKNREAQELMYSSFVPKKQETDGRYGSFQVLGDLDLHFRYGDTDTVTAAYVRELSLRDGVARTSFTRGGVRYERTYFVSRKPDVMFIRLVADSVGALSFSAALGRQERCSLAVKGDALVMSGQLDSGNPDKAGMKYRVAMRLIAKDGRTGASAEGLTLEGGTEACLIVSAATSFAAAGTDFPGERYKAECDKQLEQAARLAKVPLAILKEFSRTIQNLFSRRDSLFGAPVGVRVVEPFDLGEYLLFMHLDAHRELYDRVSLSLPSSPDDALPTDERLLRFKENPSPGLAVLYYNYGRYLLISSTRPGSLPPNLQGLWANTLWTPWNGDYHTNINIQMNYWPMEQAGLSDLFSPLVTLVERLVPSGEETARAFYGDEARGWVLHMMTNVWNYTAPGEHPSWGATNTSGAWLCAHLWDHYLYTQDVDYLKRVYPILKGAAEFFVSTTVREPRHGWLVTAPTSSPENAFYLPGDSTHAVSVCMGPTMDVQLLTELYTNVAAAARILHRDRAFAARLRSDMKQFPPMQVSKRGYLQEWLEDYREADVHHRHVSHLYGLHPGNQISPLRTPELAEACRVTLNRRGDEATGWSRAWKLNFWARLGDGNRAWKLFRSLLQPAVDPSSGRQGSGTFPNLFCSHPPFQIDGNFGGTAGIGEMLLQSHEGFIHLLPALPDCWHEGSFRGLRVRGGAAVDLDWSDGQAQRATVHALRAGTFRVKMPDGAVSADVDGRTWDGARGNSMIELNLSEGQSVNLRFSY